MLQILPESKGAVLMVKASEQLTHKDYEEVFIPTLDNLINTYGKVNVLLHLDESFSGWELGAMWDDAKFGVKHMKDFNKIGMIGAAQWVEWTTKISSYFIDGEIRNFKASELNDAMNWIKE
ncbi:MAG: STAS/SEC14 domain-containing protein [Nitrospinae bacterium]|nr:STAS/SEC14 domain-containing protein [Nitrospinota bacterium]